MGIDQLASGGDVPDDLDVDSLNTGDLTTETLSKRGSRIEQTNSQSVSSGTFTKLEFDQTSFDDYTEPDLANNKIVAGVDGKYLLTAVVTLFDAGDGTRIFCGIQVNGSEVIEASNHTGVNDNMSAVATTVADITAGDDIELSVFQDSGSELITFATERSVHLTATRI